MRRSLAAALLLLVAAGCSAGSSGSPAIPTPTTGPGGGGTSGVNFTRLTGIAAAVQPTAGIAIAFDAAAAQGLLTPIPADLDFSRQGVLCLFIGERATGGWAVTIQSIQIVEGRMQIAARETEPRGTGTGAPTYPADCVTVARADLPAGDLPATATDVTSDEFIVDGRLAIPAAASAP